MDITGIAKSHQTGIPKASFKKEWKLSDSLRKQIAGYAREVYFCTLTVSREDVRAFMAERPEYTKANRFKDIVVKVYI